MQERKKVNLKLGLEQLWYGFWRAASELSVTENNMHFDLANKQTKGTNYTIQLRCARMNSTPRNAKSGFSLQKQPFFFSTFQIRHCRERKTVNYYPWTCFDSCDRRGLEVLRRRLLRPHSRVSQIHEVARFDRKILRISYYSRVCPL
jgi:hypothetical protein